MVKVRVFDEHGELVGPVEVDRVERSDEEWRARLTSEQFRVLRGQGTEPSFCGQFVDHHEHGVYSCAGCGLPLFSSQAKFHSGTGWPSFFAPIALENVVGRRDLGQGVDRREIVCARCEGHLGHVFEDGPPPTGLRFCLNSVALQFQADKERARGADSIAQAAPAAAAETSTPEKPVDANEATATAVLAGGCFWCTEVAFESLVGVLDVVSGYCGGTPEDANYERVCDGDTGHAEAIRITYDPRRISYRQLLDVFFDAHDPTQLNRQGNDLGTQYRSAVFVANEQQRRTAMEKIAELNRSGKLPRPVVTTIEELGEFYLAEAYHQDYARRHPGQPYIAFHALPRACQVREKHPQLFERE